MISNVSDLERMYREYIRPQIKQDIEEFIRENAASIIEQVAQDVWKVEVNEAAKRRIGELILEGLEK